MVKLDLEKNRGIRDKLPTFAGSLKKKESSRETSISAFFDYAKAFNCVDHNKLWTILKQMGIPDHMTCLLKNLHAGHEATVRPGHGKQTGSKLGKEYIKAVYCHLAYLTYMQTTS